MIFNKQLMTLSLEEQDKVRTDIFAKIKTYTKGISRKIYSSQLTTIFYLASYTFTLILINFLFASLIKSVTIKSENTASFFDYFLTSITLFTNNDPSGILPNSVVIPPWVKTFQYIISFYFLVIAILAFSSSSDESKEEVKEKVNFIAKKHYDHLAIQAIKYLLRPLRSYKNPEEFKKFVNERRQSLDKD
jgi:hypothetical protein